MRCATPWVTYPGLYTAQCVHSGGATWLQVTATRGAGDPRPRSRPTLGPDLGLPPRRRQPGPGQPRARRGLPGGRLPLSRRCAPRFGPEKSLRAARRLRRWSRSSRSPTRRAAWPRRPPCSRSGVAWPSRGSRVLVVDLDPQACLTYSLGFDPDELDASLHDVLVRRARLAEVVATVPGVAGLDLVPATIDLAGAEVHLLSRTGREHVLARALEPVLDDYDAVLIDCPPSLGVLTINGLTAAEAVIVPAAVRGPEPPRRRAAARDDRGRAPVRQREAAGARRHPDHVRRPDDALAPGALRSRGALRPAGLRAVRSRSRCASPRRRASGSPCCSTRRRRRERWPTGRSRCRSTTPCRPPDDMAASRSDQAPDPLGKRALFWVPSVGGGGSDPTSACRRRCPSASGRCTRARGRDGQPGHDVGQSARRAGHVHGRMRALPADVSHVGMLDLLIFQFPLGGVAARGRFDHRMTCPSCRKRAWCSVTLRRG